MYVGDDLNVSVAFDAVTSAGSFRNAVLGLADPPAAMQGIECSMSQQGQEAGEYILKSDLQPNENVNGEATPTTTVLRSIAYPCISTSMELKPKATLLW